MSTFSGRALATALAAALGLAAATAMAQQAPDPATGPGDKAEHWRHFEDNAALHSQMVEARLAFIKTALQITPEQMPQWNAVADAMRKQSKAREAEMQAFHAQHEQQDGQRTSPDPIEMLEHRQKALAAASANLTEMIGAWKPLYASLSDSQKAIASRLIDHHEHHDWHHEMPR